MLYKKGFVESSTSLVLDTIRDNEERVARLFNDKMSQDQSHILFYHPFYKDEILTKIQLIVVGRDLNIVGQKEFLVKNATKESKLSSIILDNDLNAYFTISREEEKQDYQASEFNIYKYSCDSNRLDIYDIKLDHEIFQKPIVTVDNVNNNILISGFLEEEDKKGNEAAVGFLSVIIDKNDGSIKAQFVSEFSNQFFHELTGKDTSKQKKRLFTFQIRRVILRNDGGAIVIAESFYKESDEYSSGVSAAFSGYRSVNVYFYNDIVVFSINPSGVIDWQTILRKKQISEDDNGAYSSFGLMNTKNSLRFIYNEEIYPRADLDEYVLSGNGKVERNNLFNLDEFNVFLIPKLAKQISPNELVLPSLRKNELSLVKLNY